MDKKLKTKWIKALRSGKYRQIEGDLYRGGGYCCLGVLCAVKGAKPTRGILKLDGEDVRHHNRDGKYELAIPSFVGLRKEMQEKLARMNDSGATFTEIADYIEKRL